LSPLLIRNPHKHSLLYRRTSNECSHLARRLLLNYLQLFACQFVFPLPFLSWLSNYCEVMDHHLAIHFVLFLDWFHEYIDSTNSVVVIYLPHRRISNYLHLHILQIILILEHLNHHTFPQIYSNYSHHCYCFFDDS